MIDPGELIQHWGYPAIFLCVLAGTAGLPVPEESVLVAAGYLSWRGDLRLPLVIVVGILSAAAGDNIGYWVGRRYGCGAIERYGRRVFITPERLDVARRFVVRWGAPAVFMARFIPGLRAWAGPVAGTAGMRYLPFCVANALGAAGYAPLAIGVGYAVGHRLGDRLERFRGALGGVEHWLLAAAIVGTGAAVVWRAARARRATGQE